ncbi:SWI/SNF complex subunit SWI3D-like [Cucurbita pepo subsp. pepo]|uniref:SWI/SNF complex subunit SWI3D-like n=1 Tax=Cucurbita pepo subsp. pepo TaxID=3664 RepID=UPI000C9D57C8|nr:SWI/SNF complex subunit SWI3D-like [Cucurbita pepo subsp. pepo]
MEEKRRDAGNLPANTTDSPSSEPPSSRRRAGAQKRKVSALGGSNSSSAPSKRVTRDKFALSHPPNHNGPFTRARLGPNNGAGTASGNAAGGLSAAGSVKVEGSFLHSEAQRGDTLVAAAEELNKASRLANLEASFVADFESIKSRGTNAHVVPNHCGWFSWTKVHPIEERSMPSFFGGKSGTRNPDIYIEIRNWIMKKFHANPSTQIESKDVSEMEIGELDARQEVMEFLDHWGLINFHPFLSADSTSTSDVDDENQKDSSVEKLFHFETLESSPSVVPKTNVTTAPPRLLRESAISEEMVRPEGPSVEYHCNSCSGDCSRKRYHCQKQADFDLCSECFNNGKFDSDMSSSDFILMESAEVPGASGGKWTDQETLLLLEALELYKENWNEIAEHVATKTKAQCILHFIQMPIEDSFLESENNDEVSAKETVVPPSIENDSSVPMDITESMDNKTTGKEASNVENATKEDTVEVKVGQDNSKSKDVEVKAALDNSKSEDGGQKASEDIALNALREAFEAIGYVLTSDQHPLSFSDVGNPVMALAAFLARLVGPDVASASAHFSLKSMSQKSPSLDLATRHCFILEDPLDDKAQANPERVVNVEAQQNVNEQCEKQRKDTSTSVLDDRALSTTNSSYKNGESVTEETTMENRNSADATKEHDPMVNHGSDGTNKLKELTEPEVPKDDRTGVVKETENMESKLTTNTVEKLGEETSVEKPSQSTLLSKDIHMSDLQYAEKTEIQKPVPSPSVNTSKIDDVPNPLPSVNELQPLVAANSVKVASSDAAMVSDPRDKNEPAQTETSKSVVDQGASKVSDSLPTEENATPQPVKPNPVIDKGTDDNQSKNNEEENSKCTSKKEEKIDKLKRAAVTTLAAAAVKAKVLANQEEDQIRQLAMILIEKQLHKLERKLAYFNDMDNVSMRIREQLDRSKQRLFQERAQIIAARLGVPASASRGVAPPGNRMAMNFPISVPRPPMGMAPQRPPTSGPRV